MSVSELRQYIGKQLDSFFPDKYRFEGNDVNISLHIALERTEYCFKHVASMHYVRDSMVWFNHLHSDQYSMFLYFLSNSLWKQSENKPLCDKLIFLNKALSGMFYSYKCKLPDIFIFVHPVGTVIGNAVYSDYLVIFQDVTINTGDDYGILNPPVLGKGVVLASGSRIIGNGRIGNFSAIGANSMIYKMDVPDNSIVFTDSKGILNICQRKNECTAQKYFNINITD